eukprot:TRINITY_DN18015_c0_g3_i1.p1 TRINITY_DN18015_c0_g3~~TRINITY_DN18015_c0_g3_i1.p1  ORF type:complete len:386 (+),score=63.61 TRINITY_DN18015_c0_g3_i1:720-1877(+)
MKQEVHRKITKKQPVLRDGGVCDRPRKDPYTAYRVLRDGGVAHSDVAREDEWWAAFYQVLEDSEWWKLQIKKQKKGKAVPHWSAPTEFLHAMCEEEEEARVSHGWLAFAALVASIQTARRVPANMADSQVVCLPKHSRSGRPDDQRLINLLDPIGRAIFGGWFTQTIKLKVAEDQFGFAAGVGSRDCLAIRWAMWERGRHSGWLVGEQHWDVKKAFDQIGRQQLRCDVFKMMTDDTQVSDAQHFFETLDNMYGKTRMQIQGNYFHTMSGVRQGDNIGPTLFRVSYDAASMEFNEKLRRQPEYRRTDVEYMGQTYDMMNGKYADDKSTTTYARSEDEMQELMMKKTETWKDTLAVRGLKLNDDTGRLVLHFSGKGSAAKYKRFIKN